MKQVSLPLPIPDKLLMVLPWLTSSCSSKTQLIPQCKKMTEFSRDINCRATQNRTSRKGKNTWRSLRWLPMVTLSRSPPVAWWFSTSSASAPSLACAGTGRDHIHVSIASRKPAKRFRNLRRTWVDRGVVPAAAGACGAALGDILVEARLAERVAARAAGGARVVPARRARLGRRRLHHGSSAAADSSPHDARPRGSACASWGFGGERMGEREKLSVPEVGCVVI